MRLGVIDVGSNTVHLLVVGAESRGVREPPGLATCRRALREGLILRFLDGLPDA